jgi:hypothetical protein
MGMRVRFSFRLGQLLAHLAVLRRVTNESDDTAGACLLAEKLPAVRLRSARRMA